MAVGSIVEYIDQSRLICTVCLPGQGEPAASADARQPGSEPFPKRTLLISASQIDVAQPRDQLLQKLQQIEMLRIKLKEEIDIKECGS